jgi:hypothetical protein
VQQTLPFAEQTFLLRWMADIGRHDLRVDTVTNIARSFRNGSDVKQSLPSLGSQSLLFSRQ